MSRTFTMILALAALLSLAACNSITGPTAGPTNTIDRGGDRFPAEFDSPDEIAPDGEDGGPGSRDPLTSRPPTTRRGQEVGNADGAGDAPQNPDELGPSDGEGGGPGAPERLNNRPPATRRGQEVTP